MDHSELSKWLRIHAAADEREAGHRERMLSLVSGPRPFDRNTFLPGHFTASAFIRTPDLQSVLLIHHRKLGIWVQPGGHLEPWDHSVASAAEREALEETGLHGLVPDARLGPIFDLDVHTIPARKHEPAHEHFDVRFSFIARTEVIAVSAEVRDARWVPLTEVGELTSDESVLRAIRKFGPR